MCLLEDEAKQILRDRGFEVPRELRHVRSISSRKQWGNLERGKP
jgi:hypothetical protein